ncbi:NADP-dependent oxidoreductase [Actinokineospora pegani]|uniref:NADP-dependent oxidoreductase n=1 Tax=Actinokineospora pegani TaxID=2654637 RepID=UPI0012EA9BF9|nr:NADP-dependent oxidoreductase [Actinokineospora pegani]
MRAYGFREYGGADVQEFLELDAVEPLPGELLVEVVAAGVNPVDWKTRLGLMREFAGDVEFPATMGQEVAGVVRGVGKDVSGFTEGDEVFGYTAPSSGGFAELAVLSAAGTAHKPPKVSFTDAATLPVAGATAYDAVEQLGLSEGQTLLVNGASGGVGVAAAQIARDRGVNVIGVAGADKRELVESLGATFVEYGPGVVQRVHQVMPAVNAIFDLAGGDGLRAVAPVLDGGKLVTAGDPATAAEFGGVLVERDGTSRVLDAVASLVAEGKLDPKVEDVLDFDDAEKAVAAVEVGHAKGKVVVSLR